MTRSPQSSDRPRGWIEGQRHQLPADVADGLRRARLRHGLSFRQAAQRIGIGYGYLSDLEHSKRCPSVSVARALIEGLDLDAELAARLLDQAVPVSGRDWTPR